MANGILKKIATIQKEVGILPKDKKGPSSKGSFEYISYDSIAEKVRKLLVDNEVIVRPRVVNYLSKAEQVGTRMVVNTSVVVDYIYTDIGDQSEYVSTVAGEGSDIGGDTATRKAFSQARKIDLLQTFSIVTGEDPDTDGAESQELPAEPSKAAAKEASLEDLREKVLTYIKGDSNPDGAYEGDQVNDLGNKLNPKDKNLEWYNKPDKLEELLIELAKGTVV